MKAVNNFEEFLDADLPSKIFPMNRVTGETMFREDYFETENDVREYIKVHFKLFKEELKKELRNKK